MNNAYRPPSFSLFPPVVKNLLIANVLFLIATIIIQDTYHYDITNLLGLHYFESDKFKIYQVITYMFLHDTSSIFLQHNLSSLSHIAANMFALWMFGSVIENYWGGKRFIIFYIICGIGAALTQEATLYVYFHHLKEAIDTYALTPTQEGFTSIVGSHFQDITGYGQPNGAQEWVAALNALFKFMVDNSNTIGASGAVFGILLAYGMLFPDNLILIFFAIPMKAKYFVILYGVMELYLGIKGSTGDNVAHFAHLGGLLFGIIMILYWRRKKVI